MPERDVTGCHLGALLKDVPVEIGGNGACQIHHLAVTVARTFRGRRSIVPRMRNQSHLLREVVREADGKIVCDIQHLVVLSNR